MIETHTLECLNIVLHIIYLFVWFIKNIHHYNTQALTSRLVPVRLVVVIRAAHVSQ